jgi:hypothetical protein
MKRRLILAGCALALSGCAVTIPLGEEGRYGAIEIAYRLPGERIRRAVTVWNPPVFRTSTLGDK